MAKIVFVIVATLVAAVVLHGGWDKLKDGRAYYNKDGVSWYADKESQPFGYWFSVSVSFLFGFLMLAVMAWILIADVPVVWNE